MASTAEQLTQLFVEDLKIEASQLTPQTYLVADLAFDSLAFKITMSSIEARFGITPPERAAMACMTFGDLTELIEECVAGRGAAEPESGGR
ncbi:phosphopantetheine-binding protein [Nocardia sp. NPDC050712]|uniref:phosphopantetheine-binding protein n=1 Tax=Nocardia sp. NPDC050712 TaxID=3155518 RepID=UPI0033EFFD27